MIIGYMIIATDFYAFLVRGDDEWSTAMEAT